tara:strand:+ start:14606 stop:15931 length:1326 start_codon:yes stop_codon:yes gene_type:complete
MTTPSPIFTDFDYFKLQSNQHDIWNLLETRSQKNVVVSNDNAIRFTEKVTDGDESQIEFNCSVVPDVSLSSETEQIDDKTKTKNDLYSQFKDRLSTHKNAVLAYAEQVAEKITDATDFFVIPVAIIAGMEGHQCVLILRRNKPPFWFDPNGKWNMAREYLISTTEVHVLDIITALLSTMNGNSRLKPFLSEIPRLTPTGGGYPWPAACTVKIPDDITQIRGQSKDNWFLPDSDDIQYRNEDDGICFTISVMFILGLVCANDPKRYLTQAWWRNFYDTLNAPVNGVRNVNASFKKAYIDFLCTMLHRSVMYHLYQTMGGDMSNARVVYFDPHTCIQMYKDSKDTKNDDEATLKTKARRIAQHSMVREFRCRITRTRGKTTLHANWEYVGPIWDALDTKFPTHADTDSGRQWRVTESFASHVLTSFLNEIAEVNGYILYLERS